MNEYNNLIGKKVEETWNEINIFFPEQHFFKQVFPKRQIILHHTEGNPQGYSSVEWWRTRNGGEGTVSCPYLIQDDGDVIRLYPSYFWANCLGPGLGYLDRNSINIEICCYGLLSKTPDGFIDDLGKENYYRRLAKRGRDFANRLLIPNEDVLKMDFRWGRYFHKYTPEQIDVIVKIVRNLAERYSIDVKYNYDQMFKRNNKALSGQEGLYTHASFRDDKLDLFPQPELIAALEHNFG